MRSELFSLRLQTRSNRPPSRFSALRGNAPKPQVKSQVVVKLPVVPKAAKESASISLQPENKKMPSAASQTQCADVESPDVILIKDEEDVGQCEQDGGQSDFRSHSTQGVVPTGTQNLEAAGSSCLPSDNEVLRIVSVHGRGDGPLQEEIDTLFTASELQAFSSLSPDHTVTHDSLLSYTTSANDNAPKRLMQDNSVGLVRNSQVERNHSTQMTSMALTCTKKSTMVGADGQMGHPSHMNQFPQQQNVFTHPVSKTLDCSFCGERFLSREELIVHRATHTREPPVTCTFCGKSFVSKTTLNIHMRIHTGEKPYACSLCGKRFTQNGSLKIHLRIHSGEKPYTCTECTASFNNPSNLRRHMITHNSYGAL